MVERKIRLFDNGLEGPRFTWNERLLWLIRDTLEKLKKDRKKAYVWRVWKEVQKDEKAKGTKSLWLMARVYKRYTVKSLETFWDKDSILRIEKV